MFRKKTFMLVLVLLLSLLLPLAAAAVDWEFFLYPSVPTAAKDIGSELDKQVEAKYIDEALPKSDFTIVCTVPVALEDFNESNLLSQQLTEEISTNLVEHGYKVNELRKGEILYIEPKNGEFLLTREYSKLAENETDSIDVLVGTYVITTKHIRYNMSLLHVPTNEVLAKAAATIAITEEIYPLIEKDGYNHELRPSVQTKLP